jgi:threonine dehydrogenase-like Zn-dependent dehydrogenase
MKAYVYTKAFTIELQERPLPEPGEGDVRLKVRAVSICGSDTGGFKGTSAMRVAPLVMGHEFSGVVDAVGPGVDAAKKGLRVGVYPNIACGTCPDCQAGLPNICDFRYIPGTTMPAGGRDGAYAEYVVVPAKNLIPLPDTISFEEASMFEPASVGLRGAKMMGDIKGKTVAVFGAGPIGLLTLQSAKILGAAAVISIDVIDERLALAKKVGAAYTVNSKTEDLVAKVKEFTNGRGAYASADCVGIAPSLNGCIKITRNGGQVAMIGMGAAQIDGFEYKDCVAREISLKGSYCYVDELWEIKDLLAAGKYDFKSLITSVVPLAQIQQKMEELIGGKSKDVKVILTD